VEEQAHLAGIDLSDYIGSEVEVLGELVYSSRMVSVVEATQLIADAIGGYSQVLFKIKTGAMNAFT
jgi:hypothetical protein